MHILFITDAPELWHHTRVHALLPLIKLPPVLHDPYLLPTTGCVLVRSIVINGSSPTPRELHILLLPLTIDGVVHLYPNDCTITSTTHRRGIYSYTVEYGPVTVTQSTLSALQSAP